MGGRQAPRATDLHLERIVSGGQTGADRGALDAAIRRGIPHGGWCPKGRLAEDGPIDPTYVLTETPSVSYVQRTEWNVRDSDGTVVFTLGRDVTGGSLETIRFAARYGKPCLHISRERDADPVSLLRSFVRDHGIRTLNVAGSRESKEPGLSAWVTQVVSLVHGVKEPEDLGRRRWGAATRNAPDAT